MSSATITTGVISGAGNTEALFVPRTVRHSRAILLAHGAGANAVGAWRDPVTSPGQFAFAEDLATKTGCVVLASDFGGLTTFGNDTAVASLEAARAYLAANMGRNAKVVLVGFSMGGLNSLNYARTHPANVAAFYGVAPASDLADLRTRNVFGYKAAIETAWGISSAAALPATANPTDTANAASIASGGFPIRFAYSGGDTAVLPATVTTLAGKVNASTTQISASVDHGDAELPLVSRADLVSFIAANAA